MFVHGFYVVTIVWRRKIRGRSVTKLEANPRREPHCEIYLRDARPRPKLSVATIPANQKTPRRRYVITTSKRNKNRYSYLYYTPIITCDKLPTVENVTDYNN